MATAAFRSTTKRSSFLGSADDGAATTTTTRNPSSVRRRARSISRFSHRLPPELESPTELPEPTPARSRGKFVNTVRGAAFPEISLDDLAIELFSSSSGGGERLGGERGRMREEEPSSSQRRGRSVSRQCSRVGGGERKSVAPSARVVPDGGCSRRRRSLSVSRCQVTDCESDSHLNHNDAKGSGFRGKQWSPVHKPATGEQSVGLRRSSSQWDLLRSHDGHSSCSSALTDDESRDGHCGGDGLDKSCSTSRSKVRTNKSPSGLAQGGNMQKSSDALQAVSTVRRSYTSKLEQSEKRKQELLAEIMLEEQRGQELKRIVGELLPAQRETSLYKRPSRTRKRSNDRRRIPQHLNEEAEKIIEDFISSVEDNTDISSFDGERSDTSSTFGITARSRDSLMHFQEIESRRTPPVSGPVAVEMDGVFLPWLQWEASNNSCPPKKQIPAPPETILQDALEEMKIAHEQEKSSQSKSSHGSWSPVLMDINSVAESEVRYDKILRLNIQSNNQIISSVPKRRYRVIDVDEYMSPKSNEEVIIERWNQHERISSGGVLLCGSSFGGGFLL